jgi:hypothetical protein
MSIIKIVIPEESANELANRVIKNSHATLDGTAEAHGFSITTSLSAAGTSAKVVFLDPPLRRMRFENLEISGSVKITWLKFSPASFLGGVISNVAAGIKAANLPNIVMNATQLVSLPYQFQKTIDCQPTGSVTPTEVGVMADVALPFVNVTLPPVGTALETNLQNAILTELKKISITMPGMPMKITIPDDAQKKIAANAVEAWRLAWTELTPRLNLALQELFKRLQIIQNPLALFLVSMPAALVLGKSAPAIQPITLTAPGKETLTWVTKSNISEVKATVKTVTVDIANHELTVSLTLG